MSPYSSNHWAGSVYNIHKRRDYKAERHVLTIHALLPETCYLNNYMLLAAKKQSTADHWRRWGVAVAGWDQALALLMGAVLRLGKQSWIRFDALTDLPARYDSELTRFCVYSGPSSGKHLTFRTALWNAVVPFLRSWMSPTVKVLINPLRFHNSSW